MNQIVNNLNFSMNDMTKVNTTLEFKEKQVMLLKGRVLLLVPPKYFFEEGCSYIYTIEKYSFRSV